LGLGIGLGCVLLLSLLYIHENSFDRFIPNNENLYRVERNASSGTSYQLANVVNEEIPLVDNYFRYFQNSDVDIKNAHNTVVKGKRFAYADSSVFTCLGIDIVQGKAAQTAQQICISASTANKHFDKENPIGQTLQVKIKNQFLPLVVCGVFNDFPQNSRLYPNFIAHLDLTEEALGRSNKHLGKYAHALKDYKDWNSFRFETYLLLKPQTNPQQVEQQMQAYKHNTNNENIKGKDYKLQLVTDIYLQENNVNRRIEARRGNPAQLKYLLIISLFILLIALVNYIFLTRAKMENRLKDFGVQKTMGASVQSGFMQILLDSNVLAFASLIPALLVVFIGFPFINQTLNRTMHAGVLFMWQSLLVLLLVVLLTGCISGIIIGARVKKWSAVDLMKGARLKLVKKNAWTNSVLCIHFAVFIILLVGIITIKKQLHFAQTSSKNIDTENVIVCELNSPELSKQHSYISTELEKLSGVESTAGASFIPPINTNMTITFMHENKPLPLDGLFTGKGTLKLLNVEFLAGQDFGTYRKGQRNIIVNELAASQYQLKIGQRFNGFTISGIVKNFTSHSFHSLIQPMVIMQQAPRLMNLIAIKTTGANNNEIIKKTSDFLKGLSPDAMVKVYTLNEQIRQFYEKEQQQVKMISAFALLAIALSVMGMLGIVLHTISRKTKEIGIRKVNGAKVSEILAMLNKDFIRWVAIAFVIACPIAWYAMDKWLENFAYKTDLSWWIFVLAGLVAMVIALVTVSWQSWRAARRNPVEALRYE
jgi:putative ABC transport system permease protein